MKDNLYFYPGNHYGNNQSNTVMDAGICVDMISEFLIFCKSKNIFIKEYDDWLYKIQKHIDEYLIDASFYKIVINQRIWGLTGIATFYKLTKNLKYKNYIKKVLEKTFNEQFNDFSFPYTVLKDKKNPETYFSVYYYSRLIAFLCYVIESVGLTDLYKDRLKNSLILMYDCLDFEGKKILEMEVKHYFFYASYEVESLAYDIYVSKFINFYYKFGNLDVLKKIESIYLSHINKNGVNSNLENKPNLLCDFVNNSDFIWFIRSLKFNLNQNIETIKFENRKYPFAGFEVLYENNTKTIKIFNTYFSSFAWGVLNNTRIIIGKNFKKVNYGYNNFYGLKCFFKRNIKDIRNILSASKYNLKFYGKRIEYFFSKLKRFIRTLR
jgi:hypothetical protein